VQRAFPALSFQQPLFMLQAPGDASHWYVLEKTGRVHRFENQPGVSGSKHFSRPVGRREHGVRGRPAWPRLRA
jgi:hypothetical protein